MTHSFISIDNAVILAAGFASRMAPLSLHTPKGLLKVRGEVLIERQIRQLQEAGIREIVIVTGYKHEQFSYLANTPGVRILFNEEYTHRNNHSSIWTARNFIGNSYICSADNYFTENVFASTAEKPFYAALYAKGSTNEYCLTTDQTGRITNVTIGGSNSWYMLGHVLWDEAFSKRFLTILESEYHWSKTQGKLWETLYIDHLSELTLYLKKYPASAIQEFDTLADLCRFDDSYLSNLLP